MLILHYWTPENVCNDMEIQNWVRDIEENGFPGWSAEEENGHGVPKSFKTLEELIEFVTTIIFTASCHNSALTGTYYSYLTMYSRVNSHRYILNVLNQVFSCKRSQVHAIRT